MKTLFFCLAILFAASSCSKRTVTYVKTQAKMRNMYGKNAKRHESVGTNLRIGYHRAKMHIEDAVNNTIYR